MNDKAKTISTIIKALPTASLLVAGIILLAFAYFKAVYLLWLAGSFTSASIMAGIILFIDGQLLRGIDTHKVIIIDKNEAYARYFSTICICVCLAYCMPFLVFLTLK